MKKILVLQSGPNSNNVTYSSWIAQLGASPIILPFIKKNKDEHIEAAIEASDGVLIPGGIDVTPMLYKEDNYSAHNTNHLFDYWQLTALKVAIKLKKPVFGICRGHQLIAVHYGGTLIQDIDSEVKNAMQHAQNKNAVSRGVPMHRTFKNGKEVEYVNSLHHQSVNPEPSLLKNMRITYTADDGIVEGLEAKADNVTCVQFHPEELNSKFWNNYTRDVFGIEHSKK